MNETLWASLTFCRRCYQHQSPHQVRTDWRKTLPDCPPNAPNMNCANNHPDHKSPHEVNLCQT